MNATPIFILFFVFSTSVMAQDLPFSSLPQAPDEFTAGTSISRMVQGLGFRYYWATEGLREEDLVYRPTEEAQSTLGTLQHICNLSTMILSATKNKVFNRETLETPETLEELRILTLTQIEEAAQILQEKTDQELQTLNIIFDRGGAQSKFPTWNLINGPISDALYHTGQVVSFRRTSGNPIAKGVNVFLGVKN